ncbi:translation initiation factor IF-2-like [Chiroxiphia lanceolata]|uniref:translation initiation factor IF-2-like n=1 Tax=Chiroxiphia lanceolata TaxID=296741 RepID=UPI0013CE9102|nr:translation initiation factor IF-2-like [Chiroxiphia lanceolata]
MAHPCTAAAGRGRAAAPPSHRHRGAACAPAAACERHSPPRRGLAGSRQPSPGSPSERRPPHSRRASGRRPMAPSPPGSTSAGALQAEKAGGGAGAAGRGQSSSSSSPIPGRCAPSEQRECRGRHGQPRATPGNGAAASAPARPTAEPPPTRGDLPAGREGGRVHPGYPPPPPGTDREAARDKGGAGPPDFPAASEERERLILDSRGIKNEAQSFFSIIKACELKKDPQAALRTVGLRRRDKEACLQTCCSSNDLFCIFSSIETNARLDTSHTDI